MRLVIEEGDSMHSSEMSPRSEKIRSSLHMAALEHRHIIWGFLGSNLLNESFLL